MSIDDSVTEEKARAAQAAFDGVGGLERWIAQQRPWGRAIERTGKHVKLVRR
jgi:hypothetical protein